jgi:hypothetical protein
MTTRVAGRRSSAHSWKQMFKGSSMPDTDNGRSVTSCSKNLGENLAGQPSRCLFADAGDGTKCAFDELRVLLEDAPARLRDKRAGAPSKHHCANAAAAKASATLPDEWPSGPYGGDHLCTCGAMNRPNGAESLKTRIARGETMPLTLHAPQVIPHELEETSPASCRTGPLSVDLARWRGAVGRRRG